VAEVLLVAYCLLAMKRIVVDVMRGLGEARVGARAEIVNLTLFLSFAAPLGLWLGGKGVALALALAATGGSIVLVRRLRHDTFGVPESLSDDAIAQRAQASKLSRPVKADQVDQ
jgi:Na+-driven multidrug efflux pump